MFLKISDLCGMKRTIYQKLIEHPTAKEATVLVGARQTGKSTLLKQLRNYLESKGETVQFFNPERKGLLPDLSAHPGNIFKYLPSQENRRRYVLIGEYNKHALLM
jgi:predicted AAA+ superfamily ATPase